MANSPRYPLISCKARISLKPQLIPIKNFKMFSKRFVEFLLAGTDSRHGGEYSVNYQDTDIHCTPRSFHTSNLENTDVYCDVNVEEKNAPDIEKIQSWVPFGCKDALTGALWRNTETQCKKGNQSYQRGEELCFTKGYCNATCCPPISRDQIKVK